MKINIFSVFGQIEGVVADMMAAEGVRKIEPDLIPATVLFNDAGG